jgi:hypothetical protein
MDNIEINAIDYNVEDDTFTIEIVLYDAEGNAIAYTERDFTLEQLQKSKQFNKFAHLLDALKNEKLKGLN